MTSPISGQLDQSGVDLQAADPPLTDLTNANLRGANLTNANLLTSTLTGVVLTDANLAGANLAGSDMAGVSSGGVSGTPGSLPANWFLWNGYLIGSFDFLQDATLAGLDLSGLYMFGANFTGADLTGTSLTGADLQNAVLTRANLTNAHLTGANMTNAVTTGATWSNTICPDGTNSNSYIDGCFSPLDTTPPVVTVTRVVSGHVYVRGSVPAAGCHTTDDSAVAVKARVKVTTTGTNGVGSFTATCAGAVDRAGNDQGAPVSASYLVAYGMGSFRSPLPGSTVPKSARTITVWFRLTNAAGVAIRNTTAAALAAAKKVKSTLAGPGIKPVASVCRWAATARVFTCAIKIPGGVRTGKSERYTITAAEKLGTGFIRVPALAKAANPEVIHFR